MIELFAFGFGVAVGLGSMIMYNQYHKPEPETALTLRIDDDYRNCAIHVFVNDELVAMTYQGQDISIATNNVASAVFNAVARTGSN